MKKTREEMKPRLLMEMEAAIPRNMITAEDSLKRQKNKEQLALTRMMRQTIWYQNQMTVEEPGLIPTIIQEIA